MRTLLGFTLAIATALSAGAASAVDIEWLSVGDPGNPADIASNCYAVDCGHVPYSYVISKYEVTNSQYAEFLNAKAAPSDPFLLFNPEHSLDATFGGISRSGGSYTVKNGFADKPVVYVSFYDALRFANWLHNGQGSGDTETGAYTLLGGTPTPSNGTTVTRNPGAITFLPSENEWYKAAYFDGTSYFDYPAGTNTPTVGSAPTAIANRANCGLLGDVTEVGAYTGSASPYGTFDQGGNVFEWNEQIGPEIGSFNRGIRGGSWISFCSSLAASSPSNYGPSGEFNNVGFRVAMVPEPGTGLLVMAGVLGLAGWRRRRA